MRFFKNSFKPSFVTLLLSITFITSGCSTYGSSKTSTDSVVYDEEHSLYYSAPEISEDKPAVKQRPIEADTLYALLTAEMAGHRKRFDVALDQYLQQAQHTKDADIAERTVRIALFMGSSHHALEGLKVWLEVEPDNPLLHQTAAQVLMETGDFKQALVHMQTLQTLTGISQYDFLAANAGRLPSNQQQELLEDLQAIKLEQPKNPSLLYAEGLMLQHLKQYPESYTAIEGALRLKPDLLSAALQKARVLVLLDKPNDALKWLAKLRKKHPDNKGVHVLRARILLEQQQYDKAHIAFKELHQNFPEDSNVLLSLALLNDELGYKQEAKDSFYQLIVNEEHLSEAHFYLGRLAEEEGNTHEAISHFSQVAPSREFLAAQLRAAYLIKNEFSLSIAQEFLHENSEHYPNYRNELTRIELELLINDAEYHQALTLLNDAIERMPESLDLLYTRAMLGEKINDIKLLEADLRTILNIQPNHIDALNALGYTLADRTERYDEALELIQQAYRQKPDSPAIMDSLGWVYFRMGDIDNALPLLQKAFDVYPDHEIAAHYGELLWLTEQHEKAIEVWQAGLKNNPKSTILYNTLERLKINTDDWHITD